MPIVCELNSYEIHPWYEPRPDTWASICFPRPFVTRPRLAHGIRVLDIDKNANIRVRSRHSYLTESWVDCHLTTWLETKLHSAVDSMFVLAPADLEFLTGEHWRGAGDPSSVRVDFERRFFTPPKVVVFLNAIDLDTHHNWRLRVSASDIDVSGFTLHIDTRGDTVLYGAQAGWIAYPEDREHIYSTSVSTMDRHAGPITKAQPSYNRDVTFDKVSFWKDPSVFVALNCIDFDCNTNLRVNAYADGVSMTGLVCHIDTWCGTQMYAAGVSIIAFN